MRHDELPVFLDISIVKGSSIAKRNNKRSNRIPIPQYTIQDANVFNNEEVYEVELELDNSRIGIGSEYNTEKKIMESVNSLKKNKTIIVITHRLITVQNCDKIFMLDKGKIAKQGPPKEILSYIK